MPFLSLASSISTSCSLYFILKSFSLTWYGLNAGENTWRLLNDIWFKIFMCGVCAGGCCSATLNGLFFYAGRCSVKWRWLRLLEIDESFGTLLISTEGPSLSYSLRSSSGIFWSSTTFITDSIEPILLIGNLFGGMSRYSFYFGSSSCYYYILKPGLNVWCFVVIWDLFKFCYWA